MALRGNNFAGPFSGFENSTLFMPNQIIKRLFFENLDFHQKFPVEKYFLDVKNFDHDFRKFSSKFFEISNFEVEIFYEHF